VLFAVAAVTTPITYSIVTRLLSAMTVEARYGSDSLQEHAVGGHVDVVMTFQRYTT